MSVWKPLAAVTAVTAAFTVGLATAHPDGMPSTIGWIALAVLAVGALVLYSRV